MRGLISSPAECQPTLGWHGFAMQDARALPSTGFRPPFGLGRVTLERPKVTKGLLPRQTARFAGSLVSSNGADGAPQTAHPCADCGCAIIPDGAPDPLHSTRRFAGGTNTVPARGFIFLVDCLLRRRKRAAQGVGEIAFLLIKNCGPCEVKLTILNRLAGEWHGLSSVLYRSQVCIFSFMTRFYYYFFSFYNLLLQHSKLYQ